MSQVNAVAVQQRLDLVAEPVAAALSTWAHAHAVRVFEIDPDLSDTAAFCEAYGFALDASANCVVVTGQRAGTLRHAACMVLATTRLDVNGVVRRRLDARRASFAPMDFATEHSGMQYGGITPIGLPSDWPVWVDEAVAKAGDVVIGAGIRGAKLLLPGELLLELPGAELVSDLAKLPS